MPREIAISFAGPFSWGGTADAPSIYDVDEGRGVGIYLWTVPLRHGHLIYYVGETGNSFRARLFEHYVQHAAGMYHVYSPVEFARGEKVQLSSGRFGVPFERFAKESINNYAQLCDAIREMTSILRFFLAPTSCDRRIRRRIEAAIAQAAGAFQDQGIRYSSRTNDEEPIECVTSSPVPLLELPKRFSV